MHRSILAATHGRVFNPLLSGGGGGGGSSTTPTNVQIVLQGQDAQGASTYSSTYNTYTVPQPNHQTVAWKSVTGATSYNIYRSVNKGAYSLYASGVTPSASASAYSSYVSGSGSYDYATDVDCAYQDTAATNCVAQVTAAVSSASHPTFGTSNGYTYKVSAVTGAGESALSTDSIAIYIAGGKRIMCQDLFNGTILWADTSAPYPSPLGKTANAKWNATTYTSSGDNSQFLINPYAGAGACGWNFSTQGFNYLTLNVLCGAAGMDFNLSPELTGDSYILASSPALSHYGTLSTTGWVTLKIPLTDLMTSGLSPDIGAYFTEFYKMTFASSPTSGPIWLEWYFSVT